MKTGSASGLLTNTATGQLKAGAVSLASQGIRNAGLIGAVSGLLSLQDSQDMTNSGQLLANADSALTIGGKLDNSGLIDTRKSLTLSTGKALNNAGQLISLGTAHVQVGQGFTNQQKARLSAGTLQLQAASLSNEGTVQTGRGALQLTSTKGLTNQGTVSGGGDVTVTLAGDLQNSGTLQSTKILQVVNAHQGAIGALTNMQSGQMKAAQLDMNVASLSNAGVLGGTRMLQLRDRQDLTNSGQLLSSGSATLQVGGTVTNQGVIHARDALQLSGANGAASGALSNQSSASMTGGSVRVNASSVTNAGQLGSATGNTTVSSAATLTNSGQLLSQQDLTLALPKGLTNTGTLAAQGTLTVHGLTAKQAGGALSNGAKASIKAGQMDAHVSSLSNAGVLGATQGALTLRVQHNLSNSGQLAGNADVTLALGGTLTNSGTLTSLGQLALGGLGAGGGAGGLINQRGASLKAHALSLATQTLTNAGLIGASQGTLALTLGQDVDNSGTLASNGDLTVTSDHLLTNAGTLVSAKTLTVRNATSKGKGQLINASGGQLRAGGLSVADAAFSNHGAIQVGGLGGQWAEQGDWVNDGQITASGALVIGADGQIANQGSGAVQSAALLQLQGASGSNAGAVSNTVNGLLSGASGVAIAAASLTNAGQLGSASGAVTTALTGNLTNTGLLYGGTNLALRLDGDAVNNQGDMLAQQSLTLRGLSAANAASLVNENSGMMEAVAGDVGIASTTLSNSLGSTVKVTTTKTTRHWHSGAKNYTTVTTTQHASNIGNVSHLLAGGNMTLTGQTILNRYGEIAANGDVTIHAAEMTNVSQSLMQTQRTTGYEAFSRYHSGGGGEHSSASNHMGYTDIWTVGLPTRTTKKALTPVYGSISAGKTLTVNVTGTFNNVGTRQGAAAQSLSADAQKVAKKASVQTIAAGVSQSNSLSAAHPTVATSGAVHVVASSADKQDTQALQAVRSTSVATTSQATVRAKAHLATSTAGALATSAVAAQGLSSAGVSTLKKAALTQGHMALTHTSVPLHHTAVSMAKAPSAMTLAQSLNAHAPEKTIMANVSALQGHKALFVTQKQAKTPYLIETRSKFINLSQYVGSDYYLKQIGRDKPSTKQRQLGDSYVETRLIENQIFELTGKHYLGHQTHASDEIKALYNNAVDERKALDLKDGVALSADEITHLKKNIVWLVKERVNGQSVLVPHLYLASATLPASGAQVSGQQVAITANQVNNSGAITAGVDLTIQGLSGVNNQHGLLSSGGDLTVKTNGTLNNDSGTLKGQSITLEANNLTSDTLITRHHYSQGYADSAESQASITALDNLHITTTGNLSSVGSQISAGGNVSLDAGGDITLGSTALSHHSAVYFHHGHNIRSSLTHVQSSLTAGGALSIQSGHNLTLTGAHLKSGLSTSLLAKNNLTIQAAVDQSYSDYFKKKHHGGMFHHSKTVSRVSSSTTAHNTTVQSGGNLTLSAGNSATLAGITGLSKKNLTLKAAHDIQITSLQNHHTLHLKRSSSGTFSTSKKTEDESSTTTHASSLSAGDNLNIKTQAGSLTLTAVNLKSGAQTTLSTPKGILALNANTDEDYQQKSKHSNSTVWQGTENKGHMVTTVKGVTMTAGGGITLNAGKGVVVQYKKTGSLDASLNELAKTPGMSWVSTLRNNPKYAKKVDWQGKVEKSKHWAQKSSGLTGVGASVIQLAGSAMGFPPEVSKAVVSLINNHGNIKHTVKDLSNNMSLKGMVASAASQALTDFVSAYFDVPDSSEIASQTASQTLSAEFQQAAESHLIKAASSTVANATIAGKSLKETASHALRNAAISTVTGVVANELNQYALAHHQAIKAGDGELKKLGTELEQSAEQNLVHAVVATGVNATVGGKSLKSAATQALRQSVLTTAGQVLSEQIGDYALTHHIKEGDIRKVLAHALASCAVAAAGSKSCVASAIGAGVSELTAKTVGENKSLADQHTKANVQALIAGVADVLVQGRKAQVNDAAGAAKTVYQYNYLKHKDLVKAIAAQRAYNHCTLGHAHCSVKQLTALHNILNSYRKKSLQNSQWVQSVCKADSGSAACQKGIQDLNSYAADVKHFDAQPKGPAMLAASPYRYNTRQALGFDDLALQKAFKTGLAAGDSPKQIVEHYQSQVALRKKEVDTGVNLAFTATDLLGGAGEVVSVFSKAGKIAEETDSVLTEGAVARNALSEDVKVNRDTGLELNPKTGKWEHSGENADITASEGSIDKGLTQELSEDGLGDVTGLTSSKVKDYLSNVEDVPREQLVKDLQSMGLKVKGQSPDGRFMEFVDKEGNVRVKIHPSDKVTKYNHLHVYDKESNPLNSSLNKVDRKSPEAHIKIQ
ncbi:MAG: hypothetical protein CENE_03014 [Candidatus Celerinatantimonas neptuna]|nr:MAG: hypothetical protein CENE_03014 [Candidatus Celerinatantimonas neptuna]